MKITVVNENKPEPKTEYYHSLIRCFGTAFIMPGVLSGEASLELQDEITAKFIKTSSSLQEFIEKIQTMGATMIYDLKHHWYAVDAKEDTDFCKMMTRIDNLVNNG